jgi:hypothetical protein
LEDDEQSRVFGTKIKKLVLCPRICTYMKEAQAFLRGDWEKKQPYGRGDNEIKTA